MGLDSRYLEVIYNKKQSEIKYDLNNITAIAKLFGNPQNDLKFIHITGSNGKGSVSSILESLIMKNGYKTGLFTSPHLVDYNERFRIDQKEISDEDLKYYIDMIESKARTDGIDLSFFEISTMVAILYFRDKKVDWCIFEVGLGGRLDATNIIRSELAIITMIDYEHKRLLGNTKKRISIEKAGIIKQHTPFLTGEKNSTVRDIIVKQGKENGGLYIPDISKDIEKMNSNMNYQTLNIKINENVFSNIEFSLIGSHQIDNLNIALNAYLYLFGIPSENVLREGLCNVKWAGRLQVISLKPLIILDGCHNTSAAQKIKNELADNILKNVKGRKYLMFGMVKKKPLKKVAQMIFPLFDEIIITKFNNERSRELKSYARYLQDHPNKCYFGSVFLSLEYILSKLNKDDVLFVTGSLYLLGDLLKEYKNGRCSTEKSFQNI